MFTHLYNPEALQQTLAEISYFPNIISYSDIQNFKSSLEKENFIFHGGDCAENFAEFNTSFIDRQIKILKSIKTGTLILRGAGQFFKPRSNFYDGNKLNYFGDAINSINPDNRIPDLERLKKAYFISAAKMNYLRPSGIFTSHEALFIPYEETFLKQYENITFSSSAHMLWIGYRTAKLGSKQLEFLSKIANPVGIKIGPTTNYHELKKIINILNPRKENFKLILMLRFGAANAYNSCLQFSEFLSTIDQKIKIIIDPLHGNNIVYNSEKMRRMKDVLEEVEILKKQLQYFDGISLEFTPDDNVECVDDSQNLSKPNYNSSELKNKSLCDPRVNQFQIAKIIQKLYF
jgi:3-deoxy-D-arabino-heptulosonate 7-phosphate (DAHP) synthase class II